MDKNPAVFTFCKVNTQLDSVEMCHQYGYRTSWFLQITSHL